MEAQGTFLPQCMQLAHLATYVQQLYSYAQKFLPMQVTVANCMLPKIVTTECSGDYVLCKPHPALACAREQDNTPAPCMLLTAESAENSVVHCMEAPRKRNDRLVAIHTSVESGDRCSVKNQRFNWFQGEDSGR